MLWSCITDSGELYMCGNEGYTHGININSNTFRQILNFEGIINIAAARDFLFFVQA